MRTSTRRWAVIGLGSLFALLAAGSAAWLGLKHEPEFYRRFASVSSEHRQAEAKKFVAESLRLRNDIVNEPHWQAVFSDEEVNAWLAEDLVTQFADQIPEGVRNPRVLFDDDRVTLAFQLEQGPVSSVVWVVVRVRVPSPNQVSLTLEKIRAGALPMPADQFIDLITRHALEHGIDLVWTEEDGLPVATVRYTADPSRADVVLETLRVLKGEIHLEGRSNRGQAVASPSLPTRKVLQSTFPRRKIQPGPVSEPSGRPTAKLSMPRRLWPASLTTTRSVPHSRGS